MKEMNEQKVKPLGSPFPHVNERILCSEILSCILKYDGKIGLAAAIGILDIVKADLLTNNKIEGVNF